MVEIVNMFFQMNEQKTADSTHARTCLILIDSLAEREKLEMIISDRERGIRSYRDDCYLYLKEKKEVIYW